MFRSKEKEVATFVASYRRHMASFKASEFEASGPRVLPVEYLEEMHRVAVNAAMSDTYRIGQQIRVPDDLIDELFMDEIRANLSAGLNSDGR